MKKITDLKEIKLVFKNELDEMGNPIKVQHEVKVSYFVNVVKGWARFGHYLIDLVIIYSIIIGLAILAELMQNYQLRNFLTGFSAYLIIVGYYFISELLTQRTIGKFVTQSIVVNEYGNKPNVLAILGRSFCRLVPFEAFSCFSERGWHDQWSKTYVIKKSELSNIRRMQQEGSFVSNNEDLLD